MCQLMECTSFSISKLSGPVTFFIPFKCICHIEVCVKIFSITVICFYFYDVINTLHVISLSFITLSTIVWFYLINNVHINLCRRAGSIVIRIEPWCLCTNIVLHFKILSHLLLKINIIRTSVVSFTWQHTRRKYDLLSYSLALSFDLLLLLHIRRRLCMYPNKICYMFKHATNADKNGLLSDFLAFACMKSYVFARQ